MNLKNYVCHFPEHPRRYTRRLYSYLQLIKWYFTYKPNYIPHLFKTNTIIDFAKKYKIKNLIETGTYYGEAIDATKQYFNQIYSIEINKELYRIIKKVFSKEKKIRLFLGNSKIILPRLLKKINQRCLFWLDAHTVTKIDFNFDNSPLSQEITAISKYKKYKHIILIDDAHFYKQSGNYKKIKMFIKKRFPNYKIKIKTDIIQVYPA